jgi:hypothetical protein
MIETGAYDRPGVDYQPVPMPMPPHIGPNPLNARNVASYYLFSRPQMWMWENYLKAVKEALGNPPETANSIVDGRWDISDQQLEYIKKHFCGGAVPLANGDCP